MAKIFGSILPLFLCILPVAVSPLRDADIDKEVEKELRKNYGKGTLILRNFYSGDNLKYNLDGILVSGGESGIWTLDGFVKIHKLKVKKNTIELEGMRLIWSYDQKAKKSAYFKTMNPVKIEIGPFDSVPDISTANTAIRGVFLRINELSSQVPGHWKNFVLKEFGGTDKSVNWTPDKKTPIPSENASFPKPSPIPGKVIKSALISKIEPEYSALARKLRVGGTILFRTRVDKEGHPTVTDIINPLGVGLEESAIEAISKWVYSPTYINGEPIEVIATITVNFVIGR